MYPTNKKARDDAKIKQAECINKLTALSKRDSSEKIEGDSLMTKGLYLDALKATECTQGGARREEEAFIYRMNQGDA